MPTDIHRPTWKGLLAFLNHKSARRSVGFGSDRPSPCVSYADMLILKPEAAHPMPRSLPSYYKGLSPADRQRRSASGESCKAWQPYRLPGRTSLEGCEPP